MNRKILILLFPFFLCACDEGKKEERKEEVVLLPPQYYYYPRANVYFDSANKDYLFLASDGNTWQSAKQIPAAMHSLMDKQAPIENPSQPVWQDNANHKLVYSALLYATPNDTVEKKAPPKPVVKTKPADDSSEVEKKERKGLRRFLDKIFGGKKKEKDKQEEEQ